MTAYVALLRGINVGGKNKVPRAELRSVFESLGHEDVVTYIQSGNVVFTSTAKSARLASDLGRAIEQEFGLQVPIIVRSRAELAKVVAGNPYLDADADSSKLHVTFLAAAPSRSAIATLDPDRCPPDEFTVSGKEIFMLMPNGMGRTKLTIDYFEKRLGTTGTARNWNTVNKLLDLMAH
ncbi:MAG: DUF1697 domain-containing protein [Acidimicrobiia bacterium]